MAVDHTTWHSTKKKFDAGGCNTRHICIAWWYLRNIPRLTSPLHARSRYTHLWGMTSPTKRWLSKAIACLRRQKVDPTTGPMSRANLGPLSSRRISRSGHSSGRDSGRWAPLFVTWYISLPWVVSLHQRDSARITTNPQYVINIPN